MRLFTTDVCNDSLSRNLKLPTTPVPQFCMQLSLPPAVFDLRLEPLSQAGAKCCETCPQEQHARRFRHLARCAGIGREACRIAVSRCDMNGEVCSGTIRLKNVASRRESTSAADSETEALHSIRWIAAGKRYIEISEAIHLPTCGCERPSSRQARDIQSSRAADDIESKDSVVSSSCSERFKAGRHLHRHVDVAAIQHIGDRCV